MKTLMILAAMMACTFANAARITVESANYVEAIEPACDMCDGGVMVREYQVRLSYSACSNLDHVEIEMIVDEKPRGLSAMTDKYVTFQFAGSYRDCMGPTTQQFRTFRTNDLKKGERYIITNPSVLN